MLWPNLANISALKSDLEWLLKVMPPGEAKLYRVLIRLIPAPRAEAPNLARRRQIKMEVLAKLTGFTKRWVIELLPRLEEKNLIRTEGGRGAVKWIWRLALGLPRLEMSSAHQFAQKEKMSPGQANAPRVAAFQPKHNRKEAAQSPKQTADVNVAAPAEKPAETPVRRREALMSSIPPTNPSPAGPVVVAAVVIPPPRTAPADQGVPATTVITPPPVVPAVRVVRTTGIIPPLPPAPTAPVVPAAVVTSSPVVPARRASRRRSIKRVPAGRSHWESAPIEKLVAYACSQPVILRDLKVPGMTAHLLRLALERLCQRIERYGLIPCQDRWELISVLRTILSDL